MLLPVGDTLYFTTSSGKTQIFKSAHPEKDAWEPVDTKLTYRLHDPAFYRDDDGKVYMYWGCSDKDPIMGVEVDPKDGFRAIGEARNMDGKCPERIMKSRVRDGMKDLVC